VSHDVFISYSNKDKPTADAVCVALEANGVRCWVAPRDIMPGTDWGESIIDAINDCKIMVLVFSLNANESPQIKREVERAAHRGIPIIPLRIEEVNPSKSLEYFISTPHWLDALTPPMEKHLQHLARTVKVLLHKAGGPGGENAGLREPPQLVPQAAPASEQYRDAVEVAWANKKIETPEVQSLKALAAKIGLTESLAAEIEREIMGDTKENVAFCREEKGRVGEERCSDAVKDEEAGMKTHYSFCRKCGERVVPGAKYCRKCGNKLI